MEIQIPKQIHMEIHIKKQIDMEKQIQKQIHMELQIPVSRRPGQWQRQEEGWLLPS